MAELKTKLSDASVEVFLDGIADEAKRRDSFAILAMMQEAVSYTHLTLPTSDLV